MKNLFAGLIAALMMSVGLIAFTGTAANAAPCPYVGCAPTSTHIDPPNHVKRHHTARIGVRVTTPGNATPNGRVTVRVIRNTGGYRYIDSKPYHGGKIYFRTTKMHKLGKYTIYARFDRKAGSAFRDSNNTASFRVTRH